MVEEEQVKNDNTSGIFVSHCDSLPAARSSAIPFSDQEGNTVAVLLS